MRLYLTNLPRDITNTELAALFSPFGEVTSATAWGIACREQTPDRVGLVSLTIESKAAHAAADLMNGMVLRDQMLSVKVVVPWDT
jgi:hypothetical protein